MPKELIMADLPKGHTIQTKDFKKIVVGDKLGEAFGYIMDLRLPEYKDFSKFLIGKEGFASTNAITRSALYITATVPVSRLQGLLNCGSP